MLKVKYPSKEDAVKVLLKEGRRTETGCLISHLRPNAKGYVPVQPGGRSAPKLRAHRLVYEVLTGPIPEGFMVLHKCDVRNCINPEHLRLGTAKENTQDMLNKNRQYNGSEERKQWEQIYQNLEKASRPS